MQLAAAEQFLSSKSAAHRTIHRTFFEHAAPDLYLITYGETNDSYRLQQPVFRKIPMLAT